MSRPSVLSLAGVLLIAMLVVMSVAATYRARTQRVEAAVAPVAATPAAAAPAAAAPAAATPAAATPAAAAPGPARAVAPEPEVVVPAARADAPEAPAAAAPPADVPDLVPREANPARATREPEPAPKPQPEFGVARVKPGQSVALRAAPGGRVLTRVGATTEFGSPTTLAIAERRGNWVGLTSTDLPNGTLGWVKRRAPLEHHATKISLRIDLSRRRLELRRGRKLVRSATVGIGRPGSPTPTGRFSVTDKLSGDAYGPYYGCCILALSGHQPNTPPGWQGGDRLAIHGTSNPATIGTRASAGCLHASASALRTLMRRVPLGTPVFIRR
jgi:hypothetical protein